WYAKELWKEIFKQGKEFNVTPYGTETMHVLRAEKGFVIVGQETDGTQTPQDLGMDWIVSKKKDFIGKRSFRRLDTAKSDRHHLVGLLPLDKKKLLPEGAYIINKDSFKKDSKNSHIGYVTSSYTSDVLARTFALAMIADGRNQLGKIVDIPVGDELISAEIVDSIFYDKENRRRDG
ncbi:MAG: glycine cleavage T C-terminal barrel domain-containing protein, partial [Candidatus Nanopelagicales bacterium]